MATFDDARLRWKRRWRDGKHPFWIHPRDALPLAFEYALQAIPRDTEPDDVHSTIQNLIDDFISHHLADTKPHAPIRLDRGAKRHGRSHVRQVDRYDDERADAIALRLHMRRHAVQSRYVLARIREHKLQLGLDMLMQGLPLKTIRDATRLRGPDLDRGYKKWCLILGVAA